MSFGNRNNQHSFARVPDIHTSRSKFDRSFTVKDTYNFDVLNPFMMIEVYPGDTLNLNVRSFFRLAPQAVPIMDNMYIDFQFFYCPLRLVWDNFTKFMGEQDNPDDSTDFLIPTLTADDPETYFFPNGSIYDKLGLPTDVPGVLTNDISALPLRCLNLTWNQWHRDQNLQNSLPVPKGDGPDHVNLYSLQKRGKRHDYFTSALPFPQKGDAVLLPLGDSAPVVPSGLGVPSFEVNADGNPANLFAFSANSNATIGLGVPPASLPGVNSLNWVDPALEVDLADATSASINLFRQAILMQSLLELDARGGTRYPELVDAHFNVTVPDFRLQRVEFLSSGQISIDQHPVPQTSESTEESPQANLAAFSTAVENSRRIGFNKSIPEHGYVFGFLQARADLTYQNRLDKMWSRQTRWDFYWPKFQELGEQLILTKEIFVTGDPEIDNKGFGWQERYGELRFSQSDIRGQFRSNFSESLDVWHLAQDFETVPELTSEFIESDTPIKRALVLDAPYPDLLADLRIDLIHIRPISIYGVPATLGRF